MGSKRLILIHCIMKTRSQVAIDEAVKGLLMLKHMPIPRPPRTPTAVALTAVAAAVVTHQRPRRAGVKY